MSNAWISDIEREILLIHRRAINAQLDLLRNCVEALAIAKRARCRAQRAFKPRP